MVWKTKALPLDDGRLKGLARTLRFELRSAGLEAVMLPLHQVRVITRPDASVYRRRTCAWRVWRSSL